MTEKLLTRIFSLSLLLTAGTGGIVGCINLLNIALPEVLTRVLGMVQILALVPLAWLYVKKFAPRKGNDNEA